MDELEKVRKAVVDWQQGGNSEMQ